LDGLRELFLNLRLRTFRSARGHSGHLQPPESHLGEGINAKVNLCECPNVILAGEQFNGFFEGSRPRAAFPVRQSRRLRVCYRNISERGICRPGSREVESASPASRESSAWRTNRLSVRR